MTIGRAPGLEVEVWPLGATIHRLVVTDGDGTRRDVALGHPRPEDHLASAHYLGATIGRYANRIARGRAQVDGVELELPTNDRGQHLHGGDEGFDKREWDVVDTSDDRVELALVSPAGDQGFPGEVRARAVFEVEGDVLRLDLTATTDAPTLLGMTNHVYLNLAGHDSGPTDDHLLEVPAPAYVPIDDVAIPLDGTAPVAGTGLDLTSPRRLGDVADDQDPQLLGAGGLDHAYVVPGEGLRRLATLTSPATRLAVEVHGDLPGIQVYAGQGLGDPDRPAPSKGRDYVARSGIALEPELLPDTPNRPALGDAVLRPGQEWRARIEWRFSRPAVEQD